MLLFRASPKASISRPQNGSTGQNPCSTKIIAKANENRQVEPKNSRAVNGEREQFGASSMRSSMRPRITHGPSARRSELPARGDADRARPERIGIDQRGI